MQAEEKKEVELTTLESWSRRTWDSLSQKSVTSYLFVLALVALGLLALNWMAGARAGKQASKWIDLETLDSREKLIKYADEHRGEVVADLARLRLARMSVGTDGLMKLGTRDAEQRKAALVNLVDGRKLYLEVLPNLKKSRSLEIEAWLGAAKAEETLIGAPLEGNAVAGSADKAIEYYEKALNLLGESEEGKELKKYLTKFKESKDTVVKNYTDFYAALKPLEPIKIEDPKKAEPKKEEPKKEEAKKEEVKKEESKKEEPKKESAPPAEPKKEEPKAPEKK